jgi:hypothetical protein
MGLLNSTVVSDNSVTIKRSPYSTQIWDLNSLSSQPHDTQWKRQVQQRLQQNGKGRRRHRTLPLLARWTIALDTLRSVSASPRNLIPQQLENEIITIIRMSNGRSFPLPLWIFHLIEKDSHNLEEIKECDIEFSTALTFMCFSWYTPRSPIFRRIGLTLFRYTCPFFPEGGPILAYQRRRRLPDRSLITLISLDQGWVDLYERRDRDVWSSKWKDGSVLPQRARFIDGDSGEEHEVGILHQQLHCAATSHFTRPELHLQLASALIPHSHRYLNTPMHIEQSGSLKRTPMEIVKSQGHQELMEQLLSAGALLSIHPNEVKLRQLLRTRISTFALPYHQIPTFLVPHLPYKRLNDFEIDWNSADIITQGQNSKVYKAVEKQPKPEPFGDSFDAYAVKIIALTPTITIETIADEIWITGDSNKLIGLQANDSQVAIITPFAKGGTLEAYLPTLLIKKHDIINNSSDDELKNDQHRLQYLHPIVMGLFHRLVSQHRSQILHRDLRLSNIVLHNVSQMSWSDVEIIDWGLSTRRGLLSSTSKEAKQQNDKDFYCVNAPEVMNGEPYTFASEMWSFGMILSLWTCDKPLDSKLLDDSMVSTN